MPYRKILRAHVRKRNLKRMKKPRKKQKNFKDQIA